MSDHSHDGEELITTIGDKENHEEGVETRDEVEFVVRKFLHKLSPLDRLIYQWCVTGKSNQDQLAKALGVSRQNVSFRLARATKRLKWCVAMRNHPGGARNLTDPRYAAAVRRGAKKAAKRRIKVNRERAKAERLMGKLPNQYYFGVDDEKRLVHEAAVRSTMTSVLLLWGIRAKVTNQYARARALAALALKGIRLVTGEEASRLLREGYVLRSPVLSPSNRTGSPIR